MGTVIWMRRNSGRPWRKLVGLIISVSPFQPLSLPVRSCRDPAISGYPLGIHDHPDLIAAFTCRQLPRVSRLSPLTTSEGLDR